MKDVISVIKCHKCGKEMIWQNDFDLQDFDYEEREGIISFYDCPDCNISYEITEVFEGVE